MRLEDGTFVTVFTFEECFPYHVSFMWLVASGLPVRLNRRSTFKDYVRGFQPRIVLPHRETIHRLVELTDELQTAFIRARRAKHISSFRLSENTAPLPCIGLQLDLWTDRNSGVVYAAVHASYCADPESEDSSTLQAVQLNTELLHFNCFPHTSHTKEAIRDWMVDLLRGEGIPCEAIVGVTPDGASDGQAGMKIIPGFVNKVDVCILHELQRCVLYSIGLAGPKARCPNRDFRDIIRINRRFVQLSHQSRDVCEWLRDFQTDLKIPAHRVLSTVRTNSTRWGNQHAQIQRNNLMRPIIDPVLSRFRRDKLDDPAIVEIESDAYDSDSPDEPLGQFTRQSKVIQRREIKFDDDIWNANTEAEAYLHRPFTIKQMLEHRQTITGAQGVQLMIALKKQNDASRPLHVSLLPQSASLKDRKRGTATIAAARVSSMIQTARTQLVQQIEQRFVIKRFSDARLVQIYLSKQTPASKVLSEDNLATARALYLKWLRALLPVLQLGIRSSPRKKRKHRDLFDGLDDSDSETNEFAIDEGRDSSGDGADSSSDRVVNEAADWADIPAEKVSSFKDAHGIVDEFKLAYAYRKQLPIHYALFKQESLESELGQQMATHIVYSNSLEPHTLQVSCHLAHEGNAEETFSLSGTLSNPNTKTDPGFLSKVVRVNQNRHCCSPKPNDILKAYKRKYKKLPLLGDDVEALDENNAAQGGTSASDSDCEGENDSSFDE